MNALPKQVKRLKVCGMIAMMACCSKAMAGGLMSNTNYHIAFDRMMARGASFEVDAAYSNPAGLVWGHEGWQLSFNWQIPTQNRDIESTFPLYTEENHTKTFHGKASAPFVPGLFATYHKDNWAISAMLGIVGSGGYVRYNEGLPMFIAPLMAGIYANSSGSITPEMYDIDAQVKGKQYIYGAQVSFAHKIGDYFSASVGFRVSYYQGYYRGHVKATLKDAIIKGLASQGINRTAELINYQLDCDQSGWGVNPILGANYHNGPLTLTAKYEFRTKLNIPNSTSVNSDPDGLLSAFKDGNKTRYDIPALLSIAAGYEFTPKLRATLEYHWFDDKHAKMSNNRQEALKRGTNEFLAGVEYDINKTWTVSVGGQRTDYGLSDDYQTNTSFACDSYSIGAGVAVNVNEHVRINAGYFTTLYSDYEKQVDNYYDTKLSGTETLKRTNGVIGFGIDYKF